MAAAKLTAEWDQDFTGRQFLRLKKKRGKITIDEIENYLTYEDRGIHRGNYAIILRCTESMCEGSGWLDDYDDPGDLVELYQIEDGEKCPVCQKMTPPQYCPECGTDLWEGRSE